MMEVYFVFNSSSLSFNLTSLISTERRLTTNNARCGLRRQHLCGDLPEPKTQSVSNNHIRKMAKVYCEVLEIAFEMDIAGDFEDKF